MRIRMRNFMSGFQFRRLLPLFVFTLWSGAYATTAQAQSADNVPVAVSVGKGSYASFPPPDANGDVGKILARTPRVLDPGDRPIPTNKWWTNLIIDRYVGQLWAFPQMVKADRDGIDIFYPTRWNDRGTDPVSEQPLDIQGLEFQPTGTMAKNWSDWLVTFREAGEDETQYMDVTLGRGLPYVWTEFHGVTPELKPSGAASFFDDAGNAVALPATADHLGLESGGRCYGIFAPDGTLFEDDGGRIKVTFKGAATYLVVCPLPDKKQLAYFHQYAYAIPRDSKMTWDYSPQRGEVATTWNLATELLKGAEHRLIQGWLPHHYRDTVNDLKFDDLQYLTPRGAMKCSVGTEFHIAYPFHGFLPALPAPAASGLPNDFDAARMHDYIARYATKTDYGGDTYWGGKSLTQFAHYMAFANQLHDPSFDTLRNSLKTALTDWYTYTPGEKAHYFARYPKWGALIGFNTSYGSEGFNDNHFHYGYFTTATAMLGMYDPRFLKDYGPMARLVAKQYANWDRDDHDYPFLRTFDIWEGHSWAGGFSGGTGDNQESSSEAMQSWGGLFLLGSMMGDKEMQAAGAMGYAIESHAVMEYWFNIHGDNFAPNFGHPITGMVWSGGNNYGTYFSGDPAWIFGIQWLPAAPMLQYLVQDPAFAKKDFGDMWREYKASGKDGITSMGPALGNVILAQAAQVNPDWTAEQLDQLWAAGDKVAHDNDTPGIVYYFTHANRALGPIQWDYHMSLPMSCVYLNERTKTISYTAFNPGDTAQKVVVYRGAKPIGTFSAQPHSLACVHGLSPDS